MVKIPWQPVAGALTRRVGGVHQVCFRDPGGYWPEVNDAKD